MNEAQLYRLGLAFVTASAVIWSTAGLFTRIVHADTLTLLFWRGLFGTVGIGLFMLAWQGRASLGSLRRIGWYGLLYATISAGGMICFMASLRLSSVAHVAIIYAAIPFIAGALAWAMLGERMSRSAIVASVFALAGVVIMVGTGSGEGSLVGDGLALLMTLSMAAIMIMARWHKDTPLLAAAGLSALLSAVAMLPFVNPLDVSPRDFAVLAAFGMVNSGLGLALFTLGSRLLPPAETGLVGALDAPLAPVWVWIFFSETPTIATLAGGAIVFVAVAFHLLRAMRGG